MSKVFMNAAGHFCGERQRSLFRWFAISAIIVMIGLIIKPPAPTPVSYSAAKVVPSASRNDGEILKSHVTAKAEDVKFQEPAKKAVWILSTPAPENGVRKKIELPVTVTDIPVQAQVSLATADRGSIIAPEKPVANEPAVTEDPITDLFVKNICEKPWWDKLAALDAVATAEASSASAPGFARLGENATSKKNVGYLMAKNGIEDPTKLQIGTILKVPINPNKPSLGTKNYKVVKGDCPWKIAKDKWGSISQPGSTTLASISNASP
jgi:hypothetical protein